jgi:hypothetical protein
MDVDAVVRACVAFSALIHCSTALMGVDQSLRSVRYYERITSMYNQREGETHKFELIVNLTWTQRNLRMIGTRRVCSMTKGIDEKIEKVMLKKVMYCETNILVVWFLGKFVVKPFLPPLVVKTDDSTKPTWFFPIKLIEIQSVQNSGMSLVRGVD